jgi:hypothetical protein
MSSLDGVVHSTIKEFTDLEITQPLNLSGGFYNLPLIKQKYVLHVR